MAALLALGLGLAFASAPFAVPQASPLSMPVLTQPLLASPEISQRSVVQKARDQYVFEGPTPFVTANRIFTSPESCRKTFTCFAVSVGTDGRLAAASLVVPLGDVKDLSVECKSGKEFVGKQLAPEVAGRFQSGDILFASGACRTWGFIWIGDPVGPVIKPIWQPIRQPDADLLKINRQVLLKSAQGRPRR